MIRVLNVVHTLGYGGVEVTLLRGLPHFQERGVEVGVACPVPEGPLADAFVRRGVRVHAIRCPMPRLFAAWPLARIVRECNYDIVHSRLGYNAGTHIIGSLIAGRPSIVSIHNGRPTSELLGWGKGDPRRLALKPWIWLNRAIIGRFARQVVGHSRANLDSFWPSWEEEPERFSVVLNGIELPKGVREKDKERLALGLQFDGPLVVHVGSFKREKNHGELLHIFAALRRRYPGSRLVLVGEGGLREEVERKVRELALDEAVAFVGHQRQPDRYLAAADLLIFPSSSEGYGNVLVEAQAVGLPIVASDIPAHREAVAEAQHRFLYPLGDVGRAVELAAEQIEAARQGRNAWVEESRKVILERNSIEAMVESLVRIYRTVLSHV